MTIKNKLLFFSLIELTVSMAILAILVAASFTFFSSIQNTWSLTNNKQESFENARIALDLIGKDLDCIYYGEGGIATAPFWHWKPNSTLPGAFSIYQNGHLAFISQTSMLPNDACVSTLCEIKYHLYYSSTHDDNEGWLRRSVTGDKLSNGSDNSKYNWRSNFTGSLNLSDSAFTANSNSSDDYQKLIPYVLDLAFTCDTDTDSNSIIPPDTTTLAVDEEEDISYGSSNVFPSVVRIAITLMDRSSWDKWISLCGTGVYHAPDYTGEPDTAKTFREGHQLTLTKSVYIGNRGQTTD